MSEPKTKGIFLKALVDEVRKEKGAPGVEALKKMVGNINYAGFKDYPISIETILNKAVIKILYGEETPEAWQKFGRLGFKTYVENPIGKTMFTLFGGGDPKKLAMMADKIINTVVSGYPIKIEDVGENKVNFTFGNFSEAKEYYIGVFEAAIEYTGYLSKVGVEKIGENIYQYSIEWLKKE